jgi:hypothetical protein
MLSAWRFVAAMSRPRPSSAALYAERLQVWRLCGNASCRRGRWCRGDPFRCCRRFADWAEAVKVSAKAERDAGDPAAEALRSELGLRLRRLAETVRDES